MRIIFLALAVALGFSGSDPAASPVVFVGDSLISQGPWQRLCRRATNLGRGSATTRRLPGMTRAAIELRPAVVVIMIGVNDPLFGIPPSETAVNIKGAVSVLQQARIRVVLHRLLPVTSEYGIADFNARIHAVNRRLPANALRLRLAERDYSGDGLHLRSRAYRKWAAELRRRGVCH